MLTFGLSVGFFLIGVVEWGLDTWEKLVSVRLKFWSTILFSTLNHIIDFFMYVFLFGILIQFWETWHHGVHDYFKLIPYIAYTAGKVAGTGWATWLYARNKKAQDREKAVKHLEKARAKKKKLGQVKSDISSDVTVTTDELFDPMDIDNIREEAKERAIVAATEKITSKIDAAFNDQDRKDIAEEKQEIKDAQQQDNQDPPKV